MAVSWTSDISHNTENCIRADAEGRISHNRDNYISDDADGRISHNIDNYVIIDMEIFLISTGKSCNILR